MSSRRYFNNSGYFSGILVTGYYYSLDDRTTHLWVHENAGPPRRATCGFDVGMAGGHSFSTQCSGVDLTRVECTACKARWPKLHMALLHERVSNAVWRGVDSKRAKRNLFADATGNVILDAIIRVCLLIVALAIAYIGYATVYKSNKSMTLFSPTTMLASTVDAPAHEKLVAPEVQCYRVTGVPIVCCYEIRRNQWGMKDVEPSRMPINCVHVPPATL
jgi:hypothetical protein